MKGQLGNSAKCVRGVSVCRSFFICTSDLTVCNCKASAQSCKSTGERTHQGTVPPPGEKKAKEKANQILFSSSSTHTSRNQNADFVTPVLSLGRAGGFRVFAAVEEAPQLTAAYR